MPFALSLPLDVGPPPFTAKHTRIRYIISATTLIRDQGKQYLVRSSQEIPVISVYDRKCWESNLVVTFADLKTAEKALVSLPSPLTASDEYIKHSTIGSEKLGITAGLHRQVWVSGTNIFVDVHIVNHTKKTVKRLELALERDILCYKHVCLQGSEHESSIDQGLGSGVNT